jgi:uncharacterized membrane protein YhhN
MVILFLWLFLETGLQGFTLFFAFGILFSLLGDIWLMLPRRFFLAGLFSFLLAHVSFIVGLNQTPLPFSALSMAVGGTVFLIAILLFCKIRFGFMRMIGTLRARFPLALYGLALTLMLLSAVSTLFRDAWTTSAALMVTTGALLFFISDCMLGFDRFVKPFRHARLLVRITYHLGQMILIAGVISRYHLL